MIYDTTITIAIPVDDIDPASMISRAFDPDSGGADCFDTVRATDSSSNVYAVAHSPCSSEFAATAAYLLSDASALLAAVQADYDSRWPNIVPPDLAACQAFISRAIVRSGMALDAALEDGGLTRVIPT